MKLEGMKGIMSRRIFAGVLVAGLVWVWGCAWAVQQGPDDGYAFSIRCANYETKKIAITMDDCYDLEMVKAAVELCNKYGIVMTFFPCGQQIVPEDHDLWQSAVDAGCEIGTHSYTHKMLYSVDVRTFERLICKAQEALDAALGYHYTIRTFRPPFGKLNEDGGSPARVVKCLKKLGYQHAIMWNVSQTDPALAVKQVKDGCIMLYHARSKDVRCLDTIIPQILEMGYEPVTVCDLLGFDPPEMGGEPYVYDPSTFDLKNYQ